MNIKDNKLKNNQGFDYKKKRNLQVLLTMYNSDLEWKFYRLWQIRKK